MQPSEPPDVIDTTDPGVKRKPRGKDFGQPPKVTADTASIPRGYTTLPDDPEPVIRPAGRQTGHAQVQPSEPNKDFRVGQDRLADVRPEGRRMGMTQAASPWNREGAGYLRPLPAANIIPANTNEGAEQATSPIATLSPMIPYNKGRFAGPREIPKDTIRTREKGDNE